MPVIVVSAGRVFHPGRGVTLVELMIAVFVGSLMVYGGSRLMMQGLRSFSKSTNTLSLTQSVGIFLEGLATDIKRSRAFQADRDKLTLTTVGWTGSQVVEQKVAYIVPARRQGVERSVDGGEAHSLCRELNIKRLDFSRPLGDRGILVELEISVPPLNKESLRFKRFFYAEALPANAMAVGFQWE